MLPHGVKKEVSGGGRVLYHDLQREYSRDDSTRRDVSQVSSLSAELGLLDSESEEDEYTSGGDLRGGLRGSAMMASSIGSLSSATASNALSPEAQHLAQEIINSNSQQTQSSSITSVHTAPVLMTEYVEGAGVRAHSVEQIAVSQSAGRWSRVKSDEAVTRHIHRRSERQLSTEPEFLLEELPQSQFAQARLSTSTPKPHIKSPAANNPPAVCVSKIQVHAVTESLHSKSVGQLSLTPEHVAEESSRSQSAQPRLSTTTPNPLSSTEEAVHSSSSPVKRPAVRGLGSQSAGCVLRPSVREASVQRAQSAQSRLSPSTVKRPWPGAEPFPAIQMIENNWTTTGVSTVKVIEVENVSNNSRLKSAGTKHTPDPDSRLKSPLSVENKNRAFISHSAGQVLDPTGHSQQDTQRPQSALPTQTHISEPRPGSEQAQSDRTHTAVPSHAAHTLHTPQHTQRTEQSRAHSTGQLWEKQKYSPDKEIRSKSAQSTLEVDLKTVSKTTQSAWQVSSTGNAVKRGQAPKSSQSEHILRRPNAKKVARSKSAQCRLASKLRAEPSAAVNSSETGRRTGRSAGHMTPPRHSQREVGRPRSAQPSLVVTSTWNQKPRPTSESAWQTSSQAENSSNEATEKNTIFVDLSELHSNLNITAGNSDCEDMTF